VIVARMNQLHEPMLSEHEFSEILIERRQGCEQSEFREGKYQHGRHP
jgi:hypothetical protein